MVSLKLVQNKSKSLRICLGGKASTLYKIVFEDSDDQEGLSKMIEKVTGGIFTSIGIVFTDTPKHEVSYGLLVDKTGATDLDLTDRSHETVLGEDVLVGKTKIGIVSGLDPDKQWRVKDISQLKNFLKYLQAYSKIPVKLTKKFEGDLEGKINAELKKWSVKSIRSTKETCNQLKVMIVWLKFKKLLQLLSQYLYKL